MVASLANEQRFTWRQNHVHLVLERGTKTALWIAAVEVHEPLWILAASPVDFIDEVVHLVKDWIAHGLPSGRAG